MIQSLQEVQQIQGEAASEDLRVQVSKRHIEDILSFKFGEPSQEMRRFISNSKSDKETVSAIFQVVMERTNASEGSGFDYSNHNPYSGPIENFMIKNLVQGDPEGVWLETIADEMDTDKLRTMLGLCVNRLSLPQVIQKVRASLNDTEVSEIQKLKLERMGKILVGLPEDDPRTFYTCLSELYKNLKFAEYKPNIEATYREVGLILAELGEEGINSKKKIADIGAGTGRISNTIAAKSQNIEVYALEPSQENISVARAEDKTNSVVYLDGDWSSTDEKFVDNSLDMIIIIGRTVCHSRGPEEMEKLFQSCSRKLKVGGKIIFDLPDITKGEYLKNRLDTLKIYKNLNIPIIEPYEKYLPELDRVIDSPDGGISLYDRYTPNLLTEDLSTIGYKTPEGEIKHVTVKDQIDAIAGVLIEEIDRHSIEGWPDSENIYYSATKLSEEEARQQKFEFMMKSSH